MIRVCRTKTDLREAQERQERIVRKERRGQTVETMSIVLICKPCGAPAKDVELPNGDIVRGILFYGLEDILCVSHAVKFGQKTDGNGFSQNDLFARLVPCNRNLKPWKEGQSEQDKVPQLYIYQCNVAAPVAAPIPA